MKTVPCKICHGSETGFVKEGEGTPLDRETFNSACLEG